MLELSTSEGSDKSTGAGDTAGPVEVAGGMGVQAGGGNVQLNSFHICTVPNAQVTDRQVVVGEIPREPPAFVLRQALDRLEDALASRQVAVVCAVTGLRGVGKTQLAATYARARVGDTWGLVRWVNAESTQTLLAGLARVAAGLGLDKPNGDFEELAQRLRDHLDGQSGKGLLIFDNATDPDVLRPFLPATGSTQVVITTTDLAFAELGAAVPVDMFRREESLRYLAERTGLADGEGADLLAEELGDLPLALAQAGATIGRQRLSYPAYLDRLRRVPVAGLLGRVRGGDYPRSVAAALLLNIHAIQDDDPSGMTSLLLRVVAVLARQGVGRRLLDELEIPGRDDRRYGDVGAYGVIERCVTGSLLAWSVSGDEVVMHRLVSRVLREEDQAGGQWYAIVDAALWMLLHRLETMNDINFPPDDSWEDEARYITAQLGALFDTVYDAGDMGLALKVLGVHSLVASRMDDPRVAAALAGRALDGYLQILGPNHPETLAMQQDLDIYRLSARSWP